MPRRKKNETDQEPKKTTRTKKKPISDFTDTHITAGALLTLKGYYGTGKMLKQRLNANYGPWGGYDAVMAEVDKIKGSVVKTS